MTTAVRVFVVSALISVVAFFAAGATSGGTLPVAVGFLGLFAAIATFAVVIDATPAPRQVNHRRRASLSTWER